MSGDPIDDKLALEIARGIFESQGVGSDVIQRVPSSDHFVFAADDLIAKIYRPERKCFERELNALRSLDGKLTVETPSVIAVGRTYSADHIVMTRVGGEPLDRLSFYELEQAERDSIVDSLAQLLHEIHGSSNEHAPDDWTAFVEDRSETFLHRQIEHNVNDRIIRQLPGFIKENLQKVPSHPTVFLHGDLHFGNLRFARSGGKLTVSGVFDLADSRIGYHEYDLLAIGVLMIQGDRHLQRRFLSSYGYKIAEMDDEMQRRMIMLTMLYETSDLRRYALRLDPAAVDLDLYGLMGAIWNFV